MSVVLDAGALLAIERGDRDLIAIVKKERLAERAPLTNGGVVGQVWRGGHGRQASLARLLPGVHVQAIDEDLGRRAGVLLGAAGAGVLLGAAGAAGVVAAAVVLLAYDGDEIFTSDPTDLRVLAEAAGRHVELIRV